MRLRGVGSEMQGEMPKLGRDISIMRDADGNDDMPCVDCLVVVEAKQKAPRFRSNIGDVPSIEFRQQTLLKLAPVGIKYFDRDRHADIGIGMPMPLAEVP